jgi:hypothetical protein
MLAHDHVVRPRFCVPAAMLLAIVALCAVAVAAPAETVEIRVTVRAGTEKAATAYVAFIAPDHPMHRPSAEALAPFGTATFRLRPGTYRTLAAAAGYQDRTGSVRITTARDLQFTLEPEVSIHGTVTGSGGQPIAGARVSQARLAGPVPLGSFSDLARKLLAPAWSTSSDAGGRWTLPAHTDGTLPLLVEADGYAPALLRDPAVPCVLERGASLHADLDRADPDLVLTLLPERPDGAGLPAEWQPRVYARRADRTSLNWSAVAPGRYQVVARYLDARRFTNPVPLAAVTLAAGDRGQVRLTLPPHVDPDPHPVVLFAAGKSGADLVSLRAAGLTPAGEADEVQHATEPSSGGVLVYLRTTAAPQDLLLTTPQFVAVGQRSASKSSVEAPGATLLSARGDLSFRFVTSVASVPLPRYTMARFEDCTLGSELGSFGAFAAPVAADGSVTMPFPAVCRSLALQQAPFEPLLLEVAGAAGEKRALGELELRLGAAVEVRVVRDPGDVPAAGAIVGVLVRARGGAQHHVAEGVASLDGKVSLRGLPAAEEMLVEAIDPASELSGFTTVSIQAGTTATIDPLRIPLPARATFTVRLSRPFRERFPAARIVSIALDRDEARGPEARRTKDVAPKEETVSFERLPPGVWNVFALVEAASTIQPIPLEPIDLRPGEERHVETELEPAVIDGRVTEGGHGVAAQVGFTDAPSATSKTLFARSDEGGRFTIVLPAPGIYTASVIRLAQRDQRIGLGEIDLRDPHRAVELEIPGAVILAHVQEGEQPAAAVAVRATLRRSSLRAGVSEIVRSGTTDAAGEVRFESLPVGRWTLEAGAPGSSRSAQASADVAAADTRVVRLELQASSSLAGFVHDAEGGPLAGASVHCLFFGAGGFPQSVQAQSDAIGHFSIDLPATPPPALHCGVATPAGAIAAYTTAPTQSADFNLPRQTASLRIPDWGKQFRRGLVWLVAADGRLFDLSWAAGVLGQAWTPLAVPHLPAGSWRVVTVSTLDDWMRLGTGGAGGLTAVADFTLKAGESKTIRLEPETREGGKP